MTKTENKSWEEFDEKFPQGTLGHRHNEMCEWECSLRQNIKSFIQKLLDEQKEEILNRFGVGADIPREKLFK